MHWPQGIALFLMGLQVVMHIVKNGEPRKFDGVVAFIDVSIWFGLLFWGGFFA